MKKNVNYVKIIIILIIMEIVSKLIFAEKVMIYSNVKDVFLGITLHLIILVQMIKIALMEIKKQVFALIVN